ncbi:MAG: hypothetical protein AB8B83_08645 [Bdellovibrionales bacterium]
MDVSALDMNWKERMPDWAIPPADYFALAKKFVEAAEYQYRREGVFLAHSVTGLKLFTTDGKLTPETLTVQEAETRIIRFDNDRYHNLKDRESALKKIFENKAIRSARKTNINNPDFMGPDIWSWDEKKWEKEAGKFSIESAHEPGRFIFTDDGWEETARMVLAESIPTDFVMPYDWGQQEAQPFKGSAGGTVSGYKHEFMDLKKAIEDITEKLEALDTSATNFDGLRDAIIVKHLFRHVQRINAYVTAFDMYPQKEGFAAANFHSEAEHERKRDNEASIVSLAWAGITRTRIYGLPGRRALVPSVTEIDTMMEKNLRQQRDEGPISGVG